MSHAWPGCSKKDKTWQRVPERPRSCPLPRVTYNNPRDPSPERDLFFNMNYNNHGLKHTLFYIQLRKEMDLKMLSLGYFFKTDF